MVTRVGPLLLKNGVRWFAILRRIADRNGVVLEPFSAPVASRAECKPEKDGFVSWHRKCVTCDAPVSLCSFASMRPCCVTLAVSRVELLRFVQEPHCLGRIGAADESLRAAPRVRACILVQRPYGKIHGLSREV